MTTMAATAGESIAFSSFLSSSNFSQKTKPTSTLSLSMVVTTKSSIRSRKLVCFAVQESAAAAAAVASETKEKKEEEKKDAKTAKAAIPTAKKPPAKAPPKPLPQLMDEEVIPSLTKTLEAQKDITELELFFQDNRLEGSFLKKGFSFSFWAFFPDGNLTGFKGFSLSSYGSGVSTVEPFLVDEKRITAKHVVFWVEKRLAVQGIIPLWKE